MSRPLDIADIVVDAQRRLRPIDDAHVDMLAQSMARQKEAGLPPLIAPIEVSRSGKKYLLTDGWHRLEAAKRAGFAKIEAEIVDGDEDKRRLREVEANFSRHDLNALDRAFFTHELCRLVGGLNAPKSKSDDLKNLADQSSTIIGLPAEVAHRVGLSRSMIYEDLRIARQLKPIRRDLAGLVEPLERKQLLALAKKGAGKERDAVVEKLKAGKTYAEATATKASFETKKGKGGALTAAWSKAPAADQDTFLRTAIRNLTDKRRNDLCEWLVKNGLMTKPGRA